MNGNLTKAQLEELTHILRARFKKLRADIREALQQSDNEQYIQLAGRVHDTGDESVADLLTDVSYALIDSHIKQIQAVEHALMNIDSGAYGACIDCNADIGYARLKAEPAATRCLDCQKVHERREDMLAPHATM